MGSCFCRVLQEEQSNAASISGRGPRLFERFRPLLQVLGELEIRDGNPFLTIGIHELEGRFETLKKPYAVLEPKPDGDEVETVARGVICKSKFIVKGIVKVKAMFKMRPRVLIDKSAAAHAASAASDWAPDSPAGAPPATPPAPPPDAPMADAPPPGAS